MAKHLLEQRIVARDEAGRCSYRGVGGLKCAVGCLIKDKYYDKMMEGESADDLLVKAAVRSSLGLQRITSKMSIIMAKMQNIHDDEDPAEWGREIEWLANDQGLKWNFG